MGQKLKIDKKIKFHNTEMSQMSESVTNIAQLI